MEKLYRNFTKFRSNLFFISILSLAACGPSSNSSPDKFQPATHIGYYGPNPGYDNASFSSIKNFSQTFVGNCPGSINMQLSTGERVDVPILSSPPPDVPNPKQGRQCYELP